MKKELPKQKVVSMTLIDSTTGKKEVLKGKSIVKNGLYLDFKREPSKKWRPTKYFFHSCNIKIDTGEVEEIYITAQSKESEKECEDYIHQCYKRILDPIIDKFLEENKFNKK